MNNFDYDYDYSTEDQDFEFEDIDSIKTKKEKKTIEVYEESIEIKYEHIYQHLMNEMYEIIEDGECFLLRRIEKLLIIELLEKFNQQETAKLLGVCARTLRNKIKLYGLKDLRQDNRVLL